MRGSVDMNFLFTLGEVQRMVRAYADRQAARYGITRRRTMAMTKDATMRTPNCCDGVGFIAHPAIRCRRT